MLELCRAFADNGDAVTLITLAATSSDFYRAPDGVDRIALDVLRETHSLPSALLATCVRVRRLREAIVRARPDVVLSFMDRTNVLVLLATRATGIPVIAAERNNPWLLPIGRLWELLRRVTYGWAAAITVQAEEMRSFFPSALRRSVVVIPNAVAPAAPSNEARTQTVLAAGRLEPQKGFDVLIRAFERARTLVPGWTLRIVGEGSQRGALESLRTSLGAVACAIELPGRTNAMPAEYARAGIFVLCSRFEGFPNVLCEAMAHGCAVIATTCRSGPTEIVRDSFDGVLVPVDNVEALTAALVDLMQDPERRHTLGTRAACIPERYPTAGITRDWMRVLDDAVRQD